MLCLVLTVLYCYFFFNHTATTEIYTLSLHDALPIYPDERLADAVLVGPRALADEHEVGVGVDRKSTRLNSSHANNSYAVFCLIKKQRTRLRGPHRRLGHGSARPTPQIHTH